MTTTFSISWDYRCPFARNAHEHVLAALEAGADWDVTFTPFSLNQAHVEEGGLDVWDDPAAAPALVAMQAGIAVRDRFPDQFLAVHAALFRARHDEARDLRQAELVGDVLDESGVDAALVFEEIESGPTLATFRKEHEAAVSEHQMWGVPTFVVGDQAGFVRLMDRPTADRTASIRTIERVLDLVGGWPELNELKHTSIPR